MKIFSSPFTALSTVFNNHADRFNDAIHYHKILTGDGGHGGGGKKSGGVRCDKIRVIKLGEKIYRLILRVPRKILNGRIEISAVGESNTGEKLFIARATSDDSNSQVFAFGDKIILKNLRGKIDARMTFELQEDKNYAPGVAVYEN